MELAPKMSDVVICLVRRPGENFGKYEVVNGIVPTNPR
jgi:hypothetical protein